MGQSYASINSSGAHAPRATAGHLLTLLAQGWSSRKFYRGLGLGIRVPPGQPLGI